jgi:hypothetical protein
MKNTETRKTIAFRVNDIVRDKLRKLAEKEHRSLTREIEYLVEKEYEKSKH